MCNFWNFGHLPSFISKYGNFENWPVSLKPLPIKQNKLNFHPSPWSRKCICATSGTLVNGRFHTQIWQFWKSACISETDAHRAKINSTSTLGVERECMSNFWNVCHMAKLVLKQSLKAHGPLGLALLDYVSRDNEIEIHPSSVRPSLCGIDYLWSYCMDFFQILVVASLGSYAQKFLYIFFQIFFFDFFYEYCLFSLTWDPMGVNDGRFTPGT